MNGMQRAAAFVAAVWMSVAGAVVAADLPAVFDAGSMRVERHGERGSAVILIPGLASGAWVWKDTITALQGEHRVYAVTLAGFDGRPAVKGDVLALAAASLQELIVAQKLDKPVLVGHSLGGTLALMFAAAHSDLIGGVVAIDGLPVFPTTEAVPAAQRPALAERMRAQFAGIAPADFEAQQLQYMRRIGVVNESDAAAIAKRTARSDPQAVADYAGAVMALDLRAQLPTISVPVLEIAPYLASDYAAMGISEAAKRAYYRSLLQGVAQLDVVGIAPARHFVMVDQPLALNEALRTFLATLAAR
jgi:pimeloyl-ACP methyl ester carboxylesterase